MTVTRSSQVVPDGVSGNAGILDSLHGQATEAFADNGLVHWSPPSRPAMDDLRSVPCAMMLANMHSYSAFGAPDCRRRDVRSCKFGRGPADGRILAALRSPRSLPKQTAAARTNSPIRCGSICRPSGGVATLSDRCRFSARSGAGRFRTNTERQPPPASTVALHRRPLLSVGKLGGAQYRMLLWWRAWTTRIGGA